MRDLHMVDGRKIYVDGLDTALVLVRKRFPNAMREASLGAASFSVGNILVAEAWLHSRKPGWWLRIIKQTADSAVSEHS